MYDNIVVLVTMLLSNFCGVSPYQKPTQKQAFCKQVMIGCMNQKMKGLHPGKLRENDTKAKILKYQDQCRKDVSKLGEY